MEFTPQDYLSEEQINAETSNSFAERAETQLGKANARFNERASNSYTPSTGDMQLHSVLRQLDQTTNALERQMLEEKAMLLASGAAIQEQRKPTRRGFTQPQLSDPDELNGQDSPMNTIYGQIMAEIGSELDELLDYGRTKLDAETAEVINKSLTSDDLATARKGVEVLRALKENNLTQLPSNRKN